MLRAFCIFMVMTKRLITSFIFVAFCCFTLSAQTTLNQDSTNKYSFPVKDLTFSLGEENISFNKGVALIHNNDINGGIKLISLAIEKANTTNNITGTMSYRFYEFFDLLCTISKDDLSKTDKDIADTFLKIAFNDNLFSGTSFDIYFHQTPKSLFARRFKVMIDGYKNAPELDNELDAFLSDYPNQFSANLFKGQRLFTAKKYADAILYFSKCIEIFPQHSYSYWLRGNSCDFLNQHERALLEYDKALKLTPEYYQVEFDRAGTLSTLKREKEAIAGYKKVYSVKPSYGLTTYFISNSYRKLKMLDSALYFANEYIRFNPNKAYGYKRKGDIYFDKNKYQEAANFYTRAIEIDPTNHRYYQNRGDAYYFSDSIMVALPDFKKATELDNHSGYAFGRVADCYYRLGDYEKALPYYKTTVELAPENDLAWSSINIIYTKLKLYHEAINAGLKAVALDSTSASYSGNLGWTYYGTGEYNLCIDYSYRALKYDKTATYAMFNIALATLRKGEFEKAKGLYGKFIKECKDNGYTVNDGAITDLKDLIDQKVMVKESKFIIKNIFNKE